MDREDNDLFLTVFPRAHGVVYFFQAWLGAGGLIIPNDIEGTSYPGSRIGIDMDWGYQV